MPQTHFEGCKDRERMLEYKPATKKVLFLNKLMFIEAKREYNERAGIKAIC